MPRYYVKRVSIDLQSCERFEVDGPSQSSTMKNGPSGMQCSLE